MFDQQTGETETDQGPVISSLPQTAPSDEFNRRLVGHVRPPDWANPTPSGRYNLVVIGAGTAGLVTAAGAAGLGAKVALVERSLMGGDCLNVGCVPSKAVIGAARAAAAIRHAEAFGIRGSGSPTVEFADVMRRLRRIRSEIAGHDSAARFRDLGVDVFLGQATFTGSDSVEVAGPDGMAATRLAFKRAVIATGARAAAPPIPGLDRVDYLSNESVFSLTELPRRFGVIGAGPIGCEMAQAFAGLGSDVFLVEAAEGILPREDREAAAVVAESMRNDGVRILCCGKQSRVEPAEDAVRLTVETEGREYDETVDRLLVAVGRAPNVEGLGLDSVGVAYDQKGVRVDDRMRTTNPRIYAAGDVCSPYRFTHAADFMARIVIQNALFFGRKKMSSLVVPWCTYTSPELAHVGLTAEQARERGIEVDTFTQPLDEVDRSILEGHTDGFVRVHVRRKTDTIVGATIVGRHAGDWISEITLAMTHGLGLAKIGGTIHPYPTEAEAIRKLGDQYNRTRLTPRVRSLFGKWLAWTR